MDSTIRDLIEEAHVIFERYESHDKVLTQSIPILYFGGLKDYRSSEVKVITVGSNPSDREFLDDDGNPTDNPFWRFSGIGPPGTYEYGEYRDALGAYFEGGPDGTSYHKWFKHYDAVLRGLAASYYDDSSNTALHTDLHSPLATSEKWSNLGDEAPDLKDDLREDGIPLWHRLVEALEPDVILASLGRKKGHLEDIQFDRGGGEEVIARLHRTTDGDSRSEPYDVTAQPVQVGNGQATLVHGPKRNYPFMIEKQRQASGVGQSISCYIQE